jgi:hypothetical protein
MIRVILSECNESKDPFGIVSIRSFDFVRFAHFAQDGKKI